MGQTAEIKGIHGKYSGMITNPSTSVYSSKNGVYITDLIEVDTSTSSEDSGGIGYKDSFILGVVKLTGGGKTYLTKANNINSTVGISYY